MKKGTKIFVFITSMVLTIAGLKATICHRNGFANYKGNCHNESSFQSNDKENCRGFHQHK